MYPASLAIVLPVSCRRERAREKLERAVCIQDVRVIVNVFREQARSYKKQQTKNNNKESPV
jgi:hypothetical protein